MPVIFCFCDNGYLNGMKCSDVFLISIWSFPIERSESEWLKWRVLIRKLSNESKKL